jgi:hypothetical protein
MHERVIILSIILEGKDGWLRFIVSHISKIEMWATLTYWSDLGCPRRWAIEV